MLEYQTAEGKFIAEYFSNLEARVIQHEVDHLNGITMHDRKSENKE
jgi:peptide deformylase